MSGTVHIVPVARMKLTAAEAKMRKDLVGAFVDALQTDLREALMRTLTVLAEADERLVDGDKAVWVHAGAPLHIVMWFTGAKVLPMHTQEDWRNAERVVAQLKEAGRCPFTVRSNSVEFLAAAHSPAKEVVRGWVAAYVNHIKDTGGFMHHLQWGLVHCAVGIHDHIEYRTRPMILYGCSPDSTELYAPRDDKWVWHNDTCPPTLCSRIWCVQVHAASQGMVPTTPSERKSFSAAVLGAVNAASHRKVAVISWNPLLIPENAEFTHVAEARDRLRGAIDGEYQCTVYKSEEARAAAEKRAETQREAGQCPYRAFVRKAASQLDAYVVRFQALYRGNRERGRITRLQAKHAIELATSVDKRRHASAVKLQARARGLLVRRRSVQARCQDSGVPACIHVVGKIQNVPSAALFTHLYDGRFQLEARALPPSACTPLIADDNPLVLIPNYRDSHAYGANEETKVLKRQSFMQLLELRGVYGVDRRDEWMSDKVVNHIKRAEARKCITAAAHAALGPHPKDSTREQALAGVDAASKFAGNVEQDLVNLSWEVASVMADAQWFYIVAVHCIVNTLQDKVRRSDDDRSFARALRVHAALTLADSGDGCKERAAMRGGSNTKPENVFWVRVRTAADFLVAMLENCRRNDATGTWTWQDVHVNVPIVAQAIFRVGGKGRDAKDSGSGRFDVRSTHEIVAMHSAEVRPGIDSQGGIAQPQISIRFAYERIFSHTFSLGEYSARAKPDKAAPPGASPKVGSDCTKNVEDFAYDELWALVAAANLAGGTLPPGVLRNVTLRVAKRIEFKHMYARCDKTRRALRADYKDMLHCLRVVHGIDAKLGIRCEALTKCCAAMTASFRKELTLAGTLFAMNGIFSAFGVATSGGDLNLEPLLAECAAIAHRGEHEEATFVVETVVRMLRDPWEGASTVEREAMNAVATQAQALVFTDGASERSIAGRTETCTSASPAAPSTSSSTVAHTAPKSRKERKREHQMAAQSAREAHERDKQRQKNKRKQEKQAIRAYKATAAPPTGATRHGPVRGSREYILQLQAWEKKVRKARKEEDRMRAAEDARRREFADLHRDCNGTFMPSAKFTVPLEGDADIEDDEALQQAMVASLQMQALEQAQASAREAAEERCNDLTTTATPAGCSSAASALAVSGGSAPVANSADCADVEDVKTVEHVEQVEDVGEDALTLCVVCWEQPKVMASTPCGHRCACPTCAEQCANCPICRASVAAWLRVYD